MSTDREDLIGDYISKAAQARASKWSAIGNVFGFIISAASIVSALSKPVWWLLLPILVASFAGIMAILWCFQLMHREYISIIDNLSKHHRRSDQDKLAEVINENEGPDRIARSECLAYVLLWISSILFFAQAIRNLF